MSGHVKYKVLLVEPSTIVSQGLKEILSSKNEFEVVDTLVDTSHLFERAVVLSPDIIVVNPNLFNYSKKLTVRDEEPSLQDVTLISITYGVQHDEILKQFDETISIFDTPQQIFRKLRNASELKKTSDDQSPVSSSTYDLSDREKEILVCIARGMTNKGIADLHNISIHTVISHRKNITRKTGIKTVSGLTIYAILNNMIDIDDVE